MNLANIALSNKPSKAPLISALRSSADSIRGLEVMICKKCCVIASRSAEENGDHPRDQISEISVLRPLEFTRARKR